MAFVARSGEAVARLRSLLEAAAADPDHPDSNAIAAAAADVFAAVQRTDMRSGVANMIRRLAQLDASRDQPLPPEGWAIMRDAVELFAQAGLGPSEVRSLDERLRAVGLDVDYRPPMPTHQPERPSTN